MRIKVTLSLFSRSLFVLYSEHDALEFISLLAVFMRRTAWRQASLWGADIWYQ